MKIAKFDEYGSSFLVQIIAIYEACTLVRGLSSKFPICTDSFSTLRWVFNVSNTGFYPYSIRTILNEKFPNVKPICGPSYCGITGNEFADHLARNAISRLYFIEII